MTKKGNALVNLFKSALGFPTSDCCAPEAAVKQESCCTSEAAVKQESCCTPTTEAK